MDNRTEERIRAHYDIECVLASRLMAATRSERGTLYTEIYNELFESVPDHPQLTEKTNPEERARRTRGQAKFIYPLLPSNGTYLEVGPGTCDLARLIAETASKVYAVDVSDVVVAGDPFPDNMSMVLSDGTSVPVAAESIDLVFSNQLMEHLHPEDAEAQLSAIYQAIKPGGKYLCITPARLSGPHDVSGNYDAVAKGLHLKEYTYADCVALFKSVGFKKFAIIVGYRGWGFRAPLALGLFVEKLVGALPQGLRRMVSRIPPIRLILGLKLIAFK